MFYYTVLELLQKNLVLISSLCCLVILALLLRSKKKKKMNLPPGPKCWPIVGYIPHLSSKPYRELNALQKTYGDVIGLYLGSHYYVLAASETALREVFGSDAFLSRPDNYFAFSNEYSHLLSMSGSIWQEHRKLTKKTLRSLSTGSTNELNKLEEFFTNEITLIFEEIDANQNKDLNIRNMLGHAVNNVSFAMITGKQYDKEHNVTKIATEFQEIMTFLDTTSLVENIPILSQLAMNISPKLKKIVSAVRNMENVIRTEIQNHHKLFNEAYLNDFIDYYLLDMKQRGGETDQFDRKTLLGMAQIVILGATDTTRGSIEWALLEMAQEPKIQEKVYKEIVEILGTEKPPVWNDKEKLPYTNAVLLESLRRNTLGPFGVLRSANVDTKILGFDIPKGTRMIPLVAAAHMNPEKWEEPMKFNPHRFLNKNGELLKVLPKSFMPFSLGKRACPGERIAVTEGFLFFVSILQKFRVNPPINQKLSLEGVHRGNVTAKHPVLNFQRR